MIKRVAKYETSDGKLFDDEGPAKQHDNEITTLQELVSLLETSVRTGRVESVLRHLVLEELAVRAILLKNHQRQPKPMLKAA